jgi:hypothetical protein
MEFSVKRWQPWENPPLASWSDNKRARRALIGKDIEAGRGKSQIGDDFNNMEGGLADGSTPGDRQHAKHEQHGRPSKPALPAALRLSAVTPRARVAVGRRRLQRLGHGTL